MKNKQVTKLLINKPDVDLSWKPEELKRKKAAVRNNTKVQRNGDLWKGLSTLLYTLSSSLEETLCTENP